MAIVFCLLYCVDQIAAFLLAEVKAFEAGGVNRSLGALLQQLRRAVRDEAAAEAVSEAVEASMVNMTKSPDAVAQAVAVIDSCVSATPAAGDRPAAVYPTSLLGQFVRRTTVILKTSFFEGVSRLFSQLREYVTVEEGGMGDLAPESTLKPLPGLTAEQLSRYVEVQAARIETLVDVIPREQMQEEVDGLVAMAPDSAAVHLARYLVALHRKDFRSAVDNLHRHFDYGLKLAHKGGNSDVAPATTQYAVLNLAALHLWFGHAASASQALREAVRMAQQNRDRVCETYALALLVQVMTDDSELQPEKLLKRCRRRAAELKLWRLQALTAIYNTGPDGLPPSQMPDAASSATGPVAAPRLPDWLSFDPVTSSSPGGARLGPMGSVGGASSQIAQHAVISTDERFALEGAHHGSRQRMFEVGAHSALRDVQARLQLRLYWNSQSDAGNVDALVKHVVNKAASFRLDDDPATSGPVPALRVLASCAADIASGKHSHATGPSAMRPPLPRVANLATFSHAAATILHALSAARCELGREQALVAQLATLASIHANDEDAVLAALAEASSLAARGDRVTARQLLHQLERRCKSEAQAPLQARIWITLSALALQTANGQKHIIAGALPPLLKALSLCDSHMESLRLEGVGLLGSVLFALGRVQQSRMVLERVAPLVLEHAHAALRTAVSLTLAKCWLATGKSSEGGPQISAYNSAIIWLERAEHDASVLEALPATRECAYLAARTHHVLYSEHSVAEHLERRDAAATRFCETDATLRGSGEAQPLPGEAFLDAGQVALSLSQALGSDSPR